MMDPLLKKAFQAAQKGRSFAFATVVETTKKGVPRKSGAKMVVLEDGSVYGTIGGGRNEKRAIEACLEAIRDRTPQLVTYRYFGREGESVCGGQMRVFIEPFVGTKDLIICGGGHIALPLSVLGKMLHFRVVVIDDRPEFASKKRFPHVDEIHYGDFADVLQKIEIKRPAQTHAMIVTRGNEYDYVCLRALIDKPLAYLGVISSLAKKIKFFKRLVKEGVPETLLERVHMPAGMDIGAQTPEEIAVSIMAQIIAVDRKDRLNTDKFKADTDIRLTAAGKSKQKK